MRFSFNWLKRHLYTDLDINQIAKKLTSIGLEVDSVEDPAVIFKNFRLVQIKDAQKHTNADSLKVCVVEDRDGNKINVVCGAKNARVGLKAILALPGAVIPSSNEILKKSKIRGTTSEGMMCSYSELNIPSKNDGIIEIDPDISLSMSVGDVLEYDGGIIDVSVTPNRGDCFSVKGIARDLAAAGAGKFLILDEVVCNPSFKFPINIDCENNEYCRRYAPAIAFRVIRGVKNGSSPQWVKSMLQLANVNSVSALVDLSNFWMMDSGRPTHIYDLNKIQGDFYIRSAKVREIFVDIKGNEHKLLPDMLVTADDKSPLCLVGIMGSKKAACDENTTDILVESGLFDQIFISKTGTVLNLSSDSRTRFERGVDRCSCVSGLEGITKLILENCGGEASEIVVVEDQQQSNSIITFRRSKLNRVSGCEITDSDWDKAKIILKKLGLEEVESKVDESRFSIPSWRSDLSLEEDLIEEILRITGYEHIAAESILHVVSCKDKMLEKRNRVVAVKKLLASRGLSEVVTYSFTKKSYAEAFKESNKLISLINPISEELCVMRSSLIPSMLSNAVKSVNYGQSSLGIFESGNVFHGSCEQDFHISGVRLGNIHEKNWLEKNRPVDVFDAKGDILAIVDYYRISAQNISISDSVPSYYHPSKSGVVLCGKKEIGYFGELHPKINKLFDVSEKIICFEVFFDSLAFSNTKSSNFGSKVFPKISRDFSFLFPSNSSVGNMVNAIYKSDNKIAKVDVFDCFNLNVTQKSIGISVVLDAVDRTLTEDDAQEISDKIIKYVESVGGELRRR